MKNDNFSSNRPCLRTGTALRQT